MFLKGSCFKLQYKVSAMLPNYFVMNQPPKCFLGISVKKLMTDGNCFSQILGNLSVLSIQGHQMPELPKEAFVESEMIGTLIRLRITNGTLTSVPPESLQPLRKLKHLDLHGNQISEMKRNQFKGLRDVEVLDLSYNNLTKVEGIHLADLTKMTWFNVSNNRITEIPR